MNSYPSHHSLRDLLDDWRRRPRPVVLALVLSTSGSSYRKPGALALIDADGLAVGCISGGCLEADLVASALPLIGSGECVRRSFDTRGDDDRWFGSQSGCRGQVEVLLWPSTAAGHPLLRALMAADDAHLSTWIGASDPLVAPGISPQRPESIDGWLEIAPPRRLLMLGAGPEAPALMAMLRELGWRIDVVEHRARYLSGQRLAQADRVVAVRPAIALAEGLALDRFDAALCATHLFDEDRDCLRILAGSPVPMLGLLGPPARRDELLAELSPDYVARLTGRLEGPIGLMLGAHGPAAVALSIAARLVQRFGHV